MKYCHLILSLLISLSVAAQKLPEIGMNVRINETDKTIVAEIRPFGNEPSVEPSITYYWYSAGIIHQTQGGFSGKLLNGSYKEYFLNKNLKAQGTFSKGLKNGSWKTWNEAGVLQQIITYRNGVKSGVFSLYDENGILSKSGKYSADQINGALKTFYKDSVSVVNYKNGKPVMRKAGQSFWDKLNIFKKKHKEAANTKAKKQG